MTNLIHFELVSPEERLVSESVYMVEIPGDDGVLGVLGGHCAIVSSLRAGVVKLHKEQGGEVRKIFIAGGFADISPDNCTVLAENAVNVAELSQDSLEQRLNDLNEDLTIVKEDADLKRVKDEIILTKAKLAAVVGA